MKTHTRVGTILAAATAAVLVLSAPAGAAGPGGGGGGGGSGSGSGGSGGGSGGSGSSSTGSIYSDLVIALRAANGTPILKKYVVPATTETAATTEYCVQPVSYVAVPGVTSTTNPVDGRTVWAIPLQGAWITATDPLPLEFTGACDPQPQYAMFVSEVVLERLNLARTSEDVIASKLADVATKFKLATDIALESTGRISNDGVPIDASPENAAIYQSLMKTGTIPGLPAGMAGPPAVIGPAPADAGSNSQFNAWELAAMNIGAAASKSTPVTLDTVEYYNRVIGFPPAADPTATPPVPEYTSPWGVSFVRSADPDNPAAQLAGSEQFVDYSGFSYNRSQTFKGSVTWLDVPTLTWKVSKITDVVPFTNLTDSPIGTRTLTGITAFAQLADDVRALCNFIPDNTFIPGFYMDVPGVDTTAAQLKAIHDPAVDLGTLPADVFQTYPFQLTASLLNPWGGTLIPTAQLRLTIHASSAFTSTDVVALSAPDGQPIPFTVDANGDLVGRWGPDTGFPVAPGYNVSTTFNVTVAGGAPVGDYSVTLGLIDVADETTVLAQETGTINVHANETTVLWGDPLPRLGTQGVTMSVPVQVYSPAAGTGRLALTVTGPGDDPATAETEVTRAGDVTIYASNGADMVSMPLALNAAGQLVGTWNATLVAGYNPVTWYATVAVGALVGNYAFDVSLEGGNTLTPIVVGVSAPESHGQKPPGAGDDTTAPTVTVTSVGTLDTTATFTLAADEADVTFDCLLTTNGVAGAWERCTSPKTYSGLQPASYSFSARATDLAGNVSFSVTRTWTASAVSPLVKSDFNSDGHADVIARDTLGSLWLYPGSGKSSWLARVKVGSGWNGMTSIVAPGDFNGDGHSDLLARDAQGNLWLYPGSGKSSWLARVKVGSGWNGMTAIVAPGDFNGDTHPDLLARDGAGNLWLYPGSGKSSWLVKAKIGTGWGSMTALVGVGDFNGDTHADLLARDAQGNLWMYPGNGKGGWLTKAKVGNGWGGMTALVGPGDFSGDGHVDLIARNSQGQLWLYNGSGVASWTLPARQIGTGWNGMTMLVS